MSPGRGVPGEDSPRDDVAGTDPAMNDTAPRRGSFTVLRGRGAPPPALAGAVAALGNFDGLHRGHRAVIEAAQGLAARLGRPAVLLTFEPHPRSFFRPQEPLFRLTPEPVKLALAAALGLQGAIVLPFDAAMAGTSAQDFIGGLLVGELGLAGVAAGHDFHFGRAAREGTPGSLASRPPARASPSRSCRRCGRGRSPFRPAPSAPAGGGRRRGGWGVAGCTLDRALRRAAWRQAGPDAGLPDRKPEARARLRPAPRHLRGCARRSGTG